MSPSHAVSRRPSPRRLAPPGTTAAFHLQRRGQAETADPRTPHRCWRFWDTLDAWTARNRRPGPGVVPNRRLALPGLALARGHSRMLGRYGVRKHRPTAASFMRAWRRSLQLHLQLQSQQRSATDLPKRPGPPPAPMDWPWWPSHCLRSATIDRRPSPCPAACHRVLLAASGTVKALLACPAALHRHHSRAWVRSTTHEAPSGGLHRLKRHHHTH
ncbi:hypothetical protein M440DRAFT_158222 [Trichoderma longibrachiatum ATCC 18648]|uniref:Uncharacterized protein n=1 Tax=Trichoderma longibrachiatum ATCC 18648 TaxID=983965 RepID=A0A2T4BT45_TRILO|nr:hypothetical protein M440DRAFT_158222 [Trichoderma longibrachiatum ATCC 18648]